MKKILAVIFVALFATLGLVSCGKESDTKENTLYEIKDNGAGDVIDFYR